MNIKDKNKLEEITKCQKKCQEETSNRLIQCGGIFDGISYTGHIFRVRDANSKDIDLIVVTPEISNFKIVK